MKHQPQQLHSDYRAKKGLGQNFLVDPMAVDELIKSLDLEPSDTVIEIGPGKGALTAQIASVAKKVIAVEVDTQIIPLLVKSLKTAGITASQDPDSDATVIILNEDVLRVDLQQLAIRYGGGRLCKLIGNLPYYITTPIVEKLLESTRGFATMTVMMQKEAADRMTALPGDPEYGVMAALLRYHTEPVRVLNVGRESFDPAPNVDSTVLQLTVRSKKPVQPVNEKDFAAVIKGGFAQRRKTLGNSLMTLGVSKQQAEELLRRADLDPSRRGETLDLEEFCRLSDVYTEFKQQK